MKNKILLISFAFFNLVNSSIITEIEQDYQQAAYLLQQKIEEKNISPEDIRRIFFEIQKEQSLYHYKSISNLKKTIHEILLAIDPIIASDISIIMNKLQHLLSELKIYYHDLQHSLEVALATAQILTTNFENKLNSDPKSILLAVTAALFHDIGYSNQKEILDFLKSLNPTHYTPLFLQSKNEKFIEKFNQVLKRVRENEPLTGAEFHLYHVYLGQISIEHILSSLKKDLYYGHFLLHPDSLEKIKAMISLTDIKPDLNNYREGRQLFLKNEGLFLHGEALRTSDLVSQLSTCSRQGKVLSLYHELFLGEDSPFWIGGLSFLATGVDFYENFAKKQFSSHALSLLNQFLKSHTLTQKLLFLNLFQSKLFQIPYKKLLSGEPITEVDLAILEGLHDNELEIEVLHLFQAVKYVREKTPIPSEIYSSLKAVLEKKNSVLEVAIGDDVRITLIQDALIKKNINLALDLFQKEEFRKIDSLFAREKDHQTIEATIQTLKEKSNSSVLQP